MICMLQDNTLTVTLLFLLSQRRLLGFEQLTTVLICEYFIHLEENGSPKDKDDIDVQSESNSNSNSADRENESEVTEHFQVKLETCIFII